MLADRVRDDRHLDALRGAGLRITEQRLTIVAFLDGLEDAVTVRRLHAHLRAAGESIGLTTVYRTLGALARADEVHTFSLRGEQAFRRCSPSHHHHLRCEACGWIGELDATEIEKWVADVAAHRAFAVTTHQAEIVGRCGRCV